MRVILKQMREGLRNNFFLFGLNFLFFFVLLSAVFLKNKEEAKYQAIQSSTTLDPGHHDGKVAKTQESVIYKRTKKSALTLQVITKINLFPKNISGIQS